jgi:predicted aspartyl protease
MQYQPCKSLKVKNLGHASHYPTGINMNKGNKYPMLNVLPSRAMSVLLSGAIATFAGSCSLLSSDSQVSSPSETPEISIEQSTASSEQTAIDAPGAETSQNHAATSQPSQAVESQSQSVAAPTDTYPDAINRASSAFNLSQSAQSQDDWQLVSNRWQQAIDLMSSVPSSSPNHTDAQQKLTEYRRNLSYAREQAALPVPESSTTIISIDAIPNNAASPSNSLSQPSRSSSSRVAGLPQGGGDVFRAPIVRRAGGTPVVMVTFNGNQTFEMIVDTGASGTVITQPMARAMNVTPVGSTSVATASERNATFLLGYVRSVEVGGARSQNLLVAIAGPELSTGLLGHDFFGNYDVTVRQNVVEFRER